MQKPKKSYNSILFSETEIAERVKGLGVEISADYAGKSILAICVLKGGMIFFADLIRQITVPISCEFVQVSSYGNDRKPSAKIKLTSGNLPTTITRSEVLLIEDIVDTGQSLEFLSEKIKKLEPSSFKVCSLLDKPSRRKSTVKIDYVGFEIPDLFVVGYGMDFAQKHRNLPDLTYLTL